MPDLTCSFCRAPHTIAIGVDPDKYAATIGMSKMPATAIRIVASDGGSVATRAEHMLRMLHAPGASLVHEPDGRASWFFDAPSGVVGQLAQVAPAMGLRHETATPPHPNEWFCGRTCRSRAFASEVAAPDTAHDGATPRTRVLLAAKAVGTFDRFADPAGRVTCPCGSTQHVVAGQDAARTLSTCGWVRAGSAAAAEWRCSRQCAAVYQPAVTTPLKVCERIEDVSYQAARAKAHGLPAPALKSDATTRSRGPR